MTDEAVPDEIELDFYPNEQMVEGDLPDVFGRIINGYRIVGIVPVPNQRDGQGWLVLGERADHDLMMDGKSKPPFLGGASFSTWAWEHDQSHPDDYQMMHLLAGPCVFTRAEAYERFTRSLKWNVEQCWPPRPWWKRLLKYVAGIDIGPPDPAELVYRRGALRKLPRPEATEADTEPDP